LVPSPAEVIHGHRLRRSDLDRPRVVDQDVDPPETLDRPGDEVPGLPLVGDVGRHGQDFGSDRS